MGRKAKFSRNWKKVKARVQRIHARISNVRRDYLQRVTIRNSHAMVYIEDLQVKNMSMSAAGATGNRGKNVWDNAGLNKAILDRARFEFRRQLGCKLAWTGGYLLAVPLPYTSRTCPWCGHVSADDDRTQERFACVECGIEDARRSGRREQRERGQRLFAY